MILKTKKTLKDRGLKPVKYRGQNFLVSKHILKKIIAAAKIKAGETILEVGPGTGNLTQEILASGARVIAVEKDKNLIDILKSKFSARGGSASGGKNPAFAKATVGRQKLKIINDDILRFDETKIKQPYRLIANTPYYLTGQLIKKFLLARRRPTEMILMVQKEVAQRISARPPRANFLSSLVQFLAEPKILFKVRKENFWPRPKVDSALIQIIPHRHTPDVDSNQFIDFLRIVFRQPRQTLSKNLKRGGWGTNETLDRIFIKLGLEKNIRPQNLDIQELILLFNSVKSTPDPMNQVGANKV